VIGIPLNDYTCLGAITELVAKLVAEDHPVFVADAARFATTEELADYIRGLPQRDDDGDPDDGPREDACEPPQRVRLGAEDINCVERTLRYIGSAEKIDPRPVRQMATIDTPLGKHTFPVENGAPVILDPRLPRNCLHCATAELVAKPMPVSPREAVAFTARMAEQGAREQRNGVRLRNVEDVLLGMIEGDGERVIDEDAAEEIAWLLATAEKIAERYGAEGVAIVRATANALRDVAEERAARQPRNAAFEVAGIRVPTGPVSALARVAARYGFRAGAQAIRGQLASLGIGDEMIGEVERELNKDGYTLGDLAPKPARSSSSSTATPHADRVGQPVKEYP
jgi:hypothetical protein